MEVIRVAIAVVALSTALFADDCPECKPAKECARHVEADKEAAATLAARMKNPDPEHRQAALDDFAAACRLHANCRPASNATALAAGFADPNHLVRSRCAELLGESQDPRAAVACLAPELDAVLKGIPRNAKSDAEKIRYTEDFAELTSICRALAATREPSAGPLMAKFLAGGFDLVRIAMNDCAKVRGPEVPAAIVDALARVQKTPQCPEIEGLFGSLMNSWEVLTKSGIKPPAENSAGDYARFVKDCQKWWKDNGKTWK